MRTVFRGWQGHWCVKADWHLNTLLDFGNKKFVVSTVGYAPDPLNKGEFTTTDTEGHIFETMVFESDYGRFDDADVTKQDYDFTRHYSDELEANDGHHDIIYKVKAKYGILR